MQNIHPHRVSFIPFGLFEAMQLLRPPSGSGCDAPVRPQSLSGTPKGLKPGTPGVAQIRVGESVAFLGSAFCCSMLLKTLTHMYIYISHIYIFIYTYMHIWINIHMTIYYLANPKWQIPTKRTESNEKPWIAGFAWIKQSRPQVIYRNHYYRNGKSSNPKSHGVSPKSQGVKHPLMTHPPKSHVERAPWNDQWLVSCARSPTSNNFFQAMSRPTRSKYMAQIPKGSLVKGPYKQGLCHLLFHYCK